MKLVYAGDSPTIEAEDFDFQNLVAADKVRLFDVTEEYDPRTLSDMITETVPLTWRQLFDLYEIELKSVGEVLAKRIIQEGEVLCPLPWNIWRSLYLTPWPMVRVVIIGQDPYPHLIKKDGKRIPAATGCCFECRDGEPIQKSLSNIFRVMKNTIPGYEMPANGELHKWAIQGVLLLNASLTVNAGKAGAHKNLWSFATVRILEFLSKMHKNVVYMLWGRDAQEYETRIKKNGNLILRAAHPVARDAANSFMSCNHFNEANEYLVKHGRTPIDWQT